MKKFISIFTMLLMVLCLSSCGESKVEYAIVRFETNGGTPISSITIEKGMNYIVTASTSKEGNTFDGWFFDEEFNTPYDSAKPITTTTTLYAKWKVNEYTITFYSDSSLEEMVKKTYNYGDAVVYPDFTKEGYRISSWEIDDETSGYFETMPSKDVIVYATWIINSYQLSYVTNNDTTLDPVLLRAGDTITLPELEKKGFTLDGFYLDSALTNKLSTSTMPNSDITLYAKWNPNYYSVNFVSNMDGINIESLSLKYNDGVVLPENPIVTGYDFLGWYTDEALTTLFNQTVMDDKDITLYASFKVKSYTLTYIVNKEEETYNVNYNEALTPYSKVVEGYHLVFKLSDGTLSSVSLMPNNDLTLYGEYEISTYKITYHLETEVVESYEYGEAINYYKPTKVGYTLDSFYLDSNLVNESLYVTMPSEDLDLYPKWTINSYTVTYNFDSAMENATSSSFTHGAKLTLEAINIDGYTFIGFYSDSLFETNIALGTVLTIESDLTLYAKYSINSYKLTYIIDSVEEVHDNIKYKDILPSPTDTKTGYSILSWYKDSGYTTIYSDLTMPHNDLTLYGKFTKDIYTVTLDDTLKTEITFNLNYDTTNKIYKKISVTSLELDEMIESPVRGGYIFMGWYKDIECTSTPFDFSEPFNKNFILYAKWIENTSNREILKENEEFEVNNLIGEKYFIFVPLHTGIYSFTSSSFNDLIGKLYDSSMALITSDDDSGEGSNFSFSTTLTKGNLYYLVVNSFSGTVSASYVIDATLIKTDEMKRNTFNVSYLDDYASLVYLPLKNGSKFLGFYTIDNIEVIDKDGVPLDTFKFTSDITLYAKYELFDYNLKVYDGTNAIKDTNYHYLDDYSYIPTKEGYTFVGFYSDSTLETQVTDFIMREDDVVLYTKWTINSYTLTLVDGVTKEETTSSFDYNALLNLEALTKTGYTFKGYYLDSSYETLNNITNMPSNNLTLYTKWSINQYTISYVTNVSETADDVTIDYGASFPYPSIKVTGKSAKWYLESTFQNEVTYTTVPDKDLTIYAKWEQANYTISFDYDIEALTYHYDDLITMPSAPTKTGYTFIGYYLDSTYETLFNYTNMPDNSIYVYIKWSINSYKITVFENNSKESYDLTFVYNSDIVLTTPLKTGYTFTSYYLDSSLTTILNYTKMPASNISIYAKYKANTYTVTLGVISYYQVTYMLNDGTTTVYKEETIEEGHYLAVPTKPVRSGYVFRGWYNGSAVFDFSTKVESDLTLTASWVASSSTLLSVGTTSFSTSSKVTYIFIAPATASYNFTTSSLNGTQHSKITIYNESNTKLTSAEGANDSSPNAVININLTEGSVYYIEICSSYYPTYTSFYNISGSIIITGKTAPSSGDNSTLPDREVEVTFDSSYTLNVITKTGYIFNGYYTEDNGLGTKLTDNTGASLTSWTIPSDTVVYAYYTLE